MSPGEDRTSYDTCIRVTQALQLVLESSLRGISNGEISLCQSGVPLDDGELWCRASFDGAERVTLSSELGLGIRRRLWCCVGRPGDGHP